MVHKISIWNLQGWIHRKHRGNFGEPKCKLRNKLSNPKWHFKISCSPKVVFEMSGAKVAFPVYNGCFCGSRAFLSGMAKPAIKFARIIMGVSLSAC